MEEEIDVGEPCYSYPSYPMEEEDGPIDMSMKKRPATPPEPCFNSSSSYTSLPSYYEHSQQTGIPSKRPSVITCAARQSISESPIHSPTQFEVPSYPPPSYNAATQHHDRYLSSSSTFKSFSAPVHKVPLAREDPSSRGRHLVQTKAEAVDPEIDEHFRRSLGHDYQELLVPEKIPEPQEEPNDSVDEHFTKALGGLWTQLKAKNNGRASSPAVQQDAPPPYLEQPWKPKYSASNDGLPSYAAPIRTLSPKINRRDPNYPLSLSPKIIRREMNNPLSLSPKVFHDPNISYSVSLSPKAHRNPIHSLNLSPKAHHNPIHPLTLSPKVYHRDPSYPLELSSKTNVDPNVPLSLSSKDPRTS